jgi:hypothetical protein
LVELKPEIDALAQKYGFPREKPIDLSIAEKKATDAFAGLSAHPVHVFPLR